MNNARDKHEYRHKCGKIGPSYLLSENGDLWFLLFIFERVLSTELLGKVKKKIIGKFNFWGITLKWFFRISKLPMNSFESFPESCVLRTLSKKTRKMIGHHSRLRDMMGQSYPIYACARANHAHYSSVHVTFCGSSKYTLLK